MKKILILFLLLGCQEPDKLCNMALVVSDASEIQFTPTGQSSFNLEQMGFTDDYCFHQKFKCSSERKFQAYEVDVDNDYYLIAFDEDGVELYNEMFVKTSNLFLQALDDGINDPIGVGTNWTLGVAPTVSISSALASSKFFYLKLSGAEADTDYSFTFDILRAISGTGQVNIYVVDQNYFDTGLGSPLGSYTLSADTGQFDYTGVATVPAYIAIEVFNTVGTTAATINEFDLVGQPDSQVFKHSLSLTPSDESMCDKFVTFKIFNGPDPDTDDEIYYSDSVEFVSTWENSSSSGRVVIQYRSIQNFAGLLYDSSSEYFSIELEGRFRKQKQLTESKDLDLTESVLTTAASVKGQRKLTIDDVPDYMHKKICLIFAHIASGSVIIDGITVTGKETYEEGDRPETYPLTPSEIMFTVYYKHNVI